MNVFFVKMQELGRDYICIDCLNSDMDKKAELAVKMSRRYTGIGAFGLIFILPSAHADCCVEIYNADGSRDTGGIDGIRCVARYVYDRQERPHSEMEIETDSGIRKVMICYREEGISIRVDVGKVTNLGERKLLLPAQIVSLIDTHCVIFDEEMMNDSLEKIYGQIRNKPEFEKDIHLEIAAMDRVLTPENIHIKMRIWENETGEVISSGAAACAVSAAAVWQGYSRYDENIKVCQPGGVLTTAYLCDGRMLLEGPAVYVYEGIWKC